MLVWGLRSSVGIAALAGMLAAAAPAMGQGTLKVVMHAPLRVLDPILTTAAITVAHSYMMYDQLFGMDDKLQPKPQMIDAWTVSDDRLSYRFTLREGLKFSTGQPVTTEDVVASINRWRQRDTMASVLNASLKEMRIVDGRSFEILLTQPFGWLTYSFGKVGSNLLVIMPKAIAETAPTEAVKTHVGSGPFLFKEDEFKPGLKTVYVRNPLYQPRADAGI